MSVRDFKLCKLISAGGVFALSGLLAFAGPFGADPSYACGSLGVRPFWQGDMSGGEDGDQAQDLICLDISQGSIYISDSGYRIGEDCVEEPFQGVYKITGNSEEDHGIKILNGEHTVILENMDIDQRTLRQCCPLAVEEDSVLHLYLSGENTLFAGSGHGGITLSEGADMDIRGFGQGTLTLLAYPEKVGEELIGTSAIEASEAATVSYPCGQESCDEVQMYAGANRLSNTEISCYEDQPYLKIQYSIEHECHKLSEPANCMRGQYCLECGREIVPRTEHVPGEEATCTSPQICTVCHEILKEPLGHLGVWKEEEVICDGNIYRQEVMTCTVCKETFVRNKVME